jgi:hypothetical protein
MMPKYQWFSIGLIIYLVLIACRSIIVLFDELFGNTWIVNK